MTPAFPIEFLGKTDFGFVAKIFSIEDGRAFISGPIAQEIAERYITLSQIVEDLYMTGLKRRWASTDQSMEIVMEALEGVLSRRRASQGSGLMSDAEMKWVLENTKLRLEEG